MTREEEWQRVVLRETLLIAVPMHISRLNGLSPETLAGIARESAGVIAQHGDDLQYGGRHCAGTFNALARGLAAAALTAWGGITVAGLHWCAIPNCPGRDADHPRPHPIPPRPRRAEHPVTDLPDLSRWAPPTSRTTGRPE